LGHLPEKRVACCFTFIIIFWEQYDWQNVSLVSRTYQTLDNPTPLPLILELHSELTRNCADLMIKNAMLRQQLFVQNPRMRVH